jgi:hypothetical protein
LSDALGAAACENWASYHRINSPLINTWSHG